MLREIQVFEQNNPFEIPYDYYIGNVLTPDENLEDTYSKLSFPKDTKSKNPQYYFLKKGIIAENTLGLDAMTDKLYMSVEMFDGDLKYQPLENIKYALNDEKYKFLNNTTVNFKYFNYIFGLRDYIISEYNPIAIKLLSIIDSGTGFELKEGILTNFESREIGYMFITEKTAEKMGWSKEQAELELQKAFEDYKHYVEGEIFLINVYNIYSIYKQSRKIERTRKSNLPFITLICFGEEELKNILDEKLNEILPKMFKYKKEDLIHVGKGN